MKTLFRLAVLGFIALVLFAVFGPNLATLFKKVGNSVGGLISYTINLAPSSVQAQLVPSSQASTADLQVKVQGLTPYSTYYVVIEEDKCGGPALMNVGPFSTDENGAKLEDFPLARSDIGDVSQRTLWMNLHQGAAVSGKSVKCQQIDSSLLQHSIQ